VQLVKVDMAQLGLVVDNGAQSLGYGDAWHRLQVPRNHDHPGLAS
jgi:hypothetical protein